jgi:hypothetical protein
VVDVLDDAPRSVIHGPPLALRPDPDAGTAAVRERHGDRRHHRHRRSKEYGGLEQT